MGFMRKAAIISTGGMARVAINPNSKKARTAKASEKMLKLERARDKRANTVSRAVPTVFVPPAPTAHPSASPSVADELAKLAALRDSGVLTEQEFEIQKQKLLSDAPPAP